MCLKTVDDVRNYPDEGYGYKVFGIVDRKLMSLYRMDYAYPKDHSWVKDETTGFISAEDGSHYKVGFHIFKDVKEAREYAFGYQTVHKVQYRSATATGIQMHKEVIIATEMRILHEDWYTLIRRKYHDFGFMLEQTFNKHNWKMPLWLRNKW